MKPKKKRQTKFEKEILDYLAESGSSRARKHRFPEVKYVEDFGSGVIPYYADEGDARFIPERNRNVEDVLGFLASDMQGPEGRAFRRRAQVASSLADDRLVNYEEILHGAQYRKPFDRTLGRGVGKAKRKLRRAVKKNFSPEMMHGAYRGPGGLKGYVTSGIGSNMEAEAKAIATKAAMKNAGVIKSAKMTDSDLDRITKFYKDNPDRQDSFAQLFNPSATRKKEYRKELLDFMNKF